MGRVRDRTGEIGIFRAIGFRKGHIARLVLLEAALISALAGLIGYFLGIGAGELALPLFAHTSGAHVPFDPLLAVAALSTAVILGLLASWYPAAAAARLDPHEALRHL